MTFLAQAVTPPAYRQIRALKDLIIGAWEHLFACPHENLSFPLDDKQVCDDCGAERDYVFSPRWRYEHALLLNDYDKGYLSAAEFANYFHKRLVTSQGTVIGPWRKAGAR